MRKPPRRKTHTWLARGAGLALVLAGCLVAVSALLPLLTDSSDRCLERGIPADWTTDDEPQLQQVTYSIAPLGVVCHYTGSAGAVETTSPDWSASALVVGALLGVGVGAVLLVSPQRLGRV